MEINLKTPFIILLIVIGLGYYLESRYTVQDVLTYNKKHPDPTVSPAADYYIGMAYYTRSDYRQAAQAFSQLLTDYPTCQYAETGMLRLGESYEELMRWDEARDIYEKYLDQFPNGPHRNMVQNEYNQIRMRGK